MVAEDYDDGATRLDGVKADLVAVARGLAGPRFALIGYDNDVVDLMPLTNDLGAFAVAVQSSIRRSRRTRPARRPGCRSSTSASGCWRRPSRIPTGAVSSCSCPTVRRPRASRGDVLRTGRSS